MLNYIFYVLEASVYKKQPVARFYINDTLIDEHELTNSDFSAPLQDKIPLGKCARVIKFHTSDEIIDIKIGISNQDSNFTNGFMTKSTLVNLSSLYVVTEHVLGKIGNIRQNFKLKNDENVDKKIIVNFARCIDINFAGCPVPKEHEKRTHVYTVGGNGEYRLQLRKKLGFWLRKQDYEHGIYNLGHARVVELLADKYNNYENR